MLNIILFRALNFYLKGKLKEEIEYKKDLLDTEDLEQCNKNIEELNNIIDSIELKKLTKEYNETVNKLHKIQDKASKMNYYVGKYFKR